MANLTAHPPASRAPVEIAIDRVWRFFCSVRAAVAEIVILALLVLIGTLRGSAVPQWIADAVPASQGLIDRWYAWDVYRSPAFAVLLAVMAVAIAVCTINRVPGIWQTINNPKVRTSSGFLNSADTSATFVTAASTVEVHQRFEEALRQKRFRVLTQHVGVETHVYADKNRYGKMGTFPFHLALILLLVGGIVAAYYGFREPEFVIPIGETRDVGNGTGLSVTLDSFEDGYTPGGLPTQFQSNVSILEDGKTVRTGEITVNHPISYRNATFYQSGFGYTAQMRVT
ncbi:MAG: cytochrome c biogenesis protein ResB, partial [Chloroflexia bacterium]|nr:cytochrome c biogenesis protein ResB [Chloroflexia bacterium]